MCSEHAASVEQYVVELPFYFAVHCGAMSDIAMAAAIRRSASSLGSSIMAEVDGAASLSAAGDRVRMFSPYVNNTYECCKIAELSQRNRRKRCC